MASTFVQKSRAWLWVVLEVIVEVPPQHHQARPFVVLHVHTHTPRFPRCGRGQQQRCTVLPFLPLAAPAAAKRAQAEPHRCSGLKGAGLRGHGPGGPTGVDLWVRPSHCTKCCARRAELRWQGPWLRVRKGNSHSFVQIERIRKRHCRKTGQCRGNFGVQVLATGAGEKLTAAEGGSHFTLPKESTYLVYTRYIPTPQIRAWVYTHFWACS